jgi:DNA-binding protein HU-beta
MMNKGDLVDLVAKNTGESKRVVGDVLDELLTQVQKTVKKGEKVTLPGFGTFERRARAARTARNPQTGEPIKIKATKVPAFKAGASFKTYVSGKK